MENADGIQVTAENVPLNRQDSVAGTERGILHSDAALS